MTDVPDPTKPPDPASGDAITEPVLPGSSLQPLAARYEILSELGRGGMGVVYRARDRETGDTVAVKVLQAEIAANPELIERFKSELLLARKITHKNVCRVHDLNRFGATAAISMEYIEGESLRSLLKRTDGLSVHHAISLLRQILAGLGEAHAQGVIHRDLKPENILIARDGTVKLMDFGIARSADSILTLTTASSGTPAYMSPEQAEGKSADARSDIYSLGVVMFELFTGQHPFRADTPVALAMKHVHEAPPSPRRFEPDLPDRIERAIERCLKKDPRKRFESVGELLAALEEAPAAEFLPDTDPTPSARLLHWSRLDWALLAAGLVGMVYFLFARDIVFPASKMRLQVDAISARRITSDLASRLGRPIPETLHADASLELRSSVFYYEIAQRVFYLGKAARPGPVGSSWEVPPMVWRIHFEQGDDLVRRSATVDANGKVESLSISGWLPGNYRPPPVEDVRALASRALETACGLLTPNQRLTESWEPASGSYQASWWPRDAFGGGSPLREVSLLGEKLVLVRCYREPELELMPPSAGLWVTGTMVSLTLIALFLLGQCFTLPAIWSRLPLAVLTGMFGAWLLSPSAASMPQLPVWLVAAAVAVAVVFVGLVTAEHFLRRRAPDLIASYVLAFRGRVTDPAVTIAVVRGALAGLALAGLETASAHWGLFINQTWTGASTWQKVLQIVGAVYLDPAPLATVVRSNSPALFVAGAVLFTATLVAVVFLGTTRALLAKKFQTAKSRRQRFDAIFTGGFFWWLSGLHLYLVGFTLFPIGMIIVYSVEASLLSWLLNRFDVLTVFAAVATAVLWTLNYPLLVIFSEVGNAPHWALFLIWAAVVLSAAALAFRSALGDVRQRLSASFE